MSRDSDELVVAGDGTLWVAPVGTTLPTTPTAPPNAAFADLGYNTEDGVTFGVSTEVEDIGAWQSRDPVRRLLTGREITLSTELMQWNADTLATAWGGGEVTDLGGSVYRYDFPDDDENVVEQAVLLDLVDGDKTYRIVLPRVTINDSSETQWTRTAAGLLTVSLKALKPDTGATAYILTDDPAFMPAS